MSTKKRIINCEIAEDAHRAARHRSLDTGETLGEIVTEALRTFLQAGTAGSGRLPEPVTPARAKGRSHEQEEGNQRARGSA